MPPTGNNDKSWRRLKLVKDFFTAEKVDWDKLERLCSDGAPGMLRVRADFLTLVKQKICHVWKALDCSKRVVIKKYITKQEIDCATKVVNYI